MGVKGLGTLSTNISFLVCVMKNYTVFLACFSCVTLMKMNFYIKNMTTCGFFWRVLGF